jgi:hypothetical protein
MVLANTYLPVEIWKPLQGWSYDINNFGKVRNFKGHILAQRAHKSGYMDTQLSRNGKCYTVSVHRLVATTFIGLPPSIKHEVAHSNGNRHDNRASNLRWVLHKENMRDRDLHGTTAIGARNGKLKHSDEQVAQIRNMHASGLGYRKISKITSIHRAVVRGYVLRIRRKTIVENQF